MLWTLEKLRKAIFCYEMIKVLLREAKFSENMLYWNVCIGKSWKSHFVTEKKDMKVILLIYDISGISDISDVSGSRIII